MKRLIFIISAFSVALFFLPSCIRVEEDKREDMVVEEGLEVYRQTYRVLEPVWRVLDVTLKVDRYLKAENDYERYYLADILFYQYAQVRVDEVNSCVLIGDEYYSDRVSYTDASILEPGTEWKCKINNIEATVVSLGDNRWEVIVDVDKSQGYEISLTEIVYKATVFNIDELYQEGTSFSGLVYEVETSGTYEELSEVRKENVLVVVDFRTDGTVMVENGRFYDGIFDLHLKCDEPVVRDEDIRVQLSSSGENTRVTVTYMGETGYWIWY